MKKILILYFEYYKLYKCNTMFSDFIRTNCAWKTFNTKYDLFNNKCEMK